MRVYDAAAARRAAVVREDDPLAKADIQAMFEKVSNALYIELKTWLDNNCFIMQDIPKASNIMASRHVDILKRVMNEKAHMERTNRLRLVFLRGFMDLEAIGAEAFSGTARRSSQRLLASAAACK
eukprot:2480309-Pyramimonas_sp.AAC.2